MVLLWNSHTSYPVFASHNAILHVRLKEAVIHLRSCTDLIGSALLEETKAPASATTVTSYGHLTREQGGSEIRLLEPINQPLIIIEFSKLSKGISRSFRGLTADRKFISSDTKLCIAAAQATVPFGICSAPFR